MTAHAAAVRTAGGVATAHTAAAFVATEQANAALFDGGVADAAGAVATAAGVQVPAAPVIAAAPPVAAPPAMPVEAFSAAAHRGPGSTGFRQATAAWQARAAVLGELVDDTIAQAKLIAESWNDDGWQQTATNTMAHAGWLDAAATPAQALADAAEAIADDFDRVRMYTLPRSSSPTPANRSRPPRPAATRWGSVRPGAPTPSWPPRPTTPWSNITPRPPTPPPDSIRRCRRPRPSPPRPRPVQPVLLS